MNLSNYLPTLLTHQTKLLRRLLPVAVLLLTALLVVGCGGSATPAPTPSPTPEIDGDAAALEQFCTLYSDMSTELSTRAGEVANELATCEDCDLQAKYDEAFAAVHAYYGQMLDIAPEEIQEAVQRVAAATPREVFGDELYNDELMQINRYSALQCSPYLTPADSGG
jgi:hypothetical protein